jgi:polyphosphate kinase 2 (PPK2 family)
MPRQELIHLIGKYVTTCRMSKGKGLRLKDFDEPEKNWKFSPSGVQERNFWDD